MTSGSFESLVYRIAFCLARGLTLPTATRLLDLCGGSEERFFEVPENELAVAAGFKSRIFRADFRSALLERARREAEYAEAHSIRVLTFRDSGYPRRLLDCDDAPLMLFALGDTDFNRGRVIGIVGTRHATAYGIGFVERLVTELRDFTDEPLLIVSGLAYGIDVAAHRASIAASVPTVGVVAHGLNTIYPADHRSVAAEMIHSGGALLTEYTPSDAVHKGNFLARNRIVAGICDALVVAESALKGGSLVTARIASDYGREVFALPGRIADRYSSGCNRLIATHSATLLDSAEALADMIGLRRRPQADSVPSLFNDLPPDHQSIIDALSGGDAHISRLAAITGVAHGRLNAMLLELEFKGLVTRCPGGIYALLKS